MKFEVGQTLYRARSRIVEETREVTGNTCECCGSSLGRSFTEIRSKAVYELDKVIIYALGPAGVFVEMFKSIDFYNDDTKTELITHRLSNYMTDKYECEKLIYNLNRDQQWSEWEECRNHRARVVFDSDFTGCGSVGPGDVEWNEVDVE